MDDLLVFELEDDELDLFLQDVNEHLQVMETGILALEQGGLKQAGALERLNAIFRAAHTLKAVGATVGHHRMADLTHTMETLFDGMRKGTLTVNQAVVDDLLAAVDALKALRDEVVTREPSGMDVAPLIAWLNSFIEQAASDESATMTKPLPVKERGETSTELEKGGVKSSLLPTASVIPQNMQFSGMGPRQLTLEQVGHIQDYRETGYTILNVEVTVAPDAFAPTARLMQAVMAVMEEGEVVVQYPSQADLAAERHEGYLWLLLATQVDFEEIETLLAEISDIDEICVSPYRATREQVELESMMPEMYAERAEGKEGRPALGIEQTGAEGIRAGQDTVRISVERLDTLMNLVGELVTDRTRMLQIQEMLRIQYNLGRNRQRDGVFGALDELSTHFERVVDQLQHEVMQARMLPIATLFQKFPRLVRDVARAADKQVNLVIRGETTELDRSIIEAVGDPLIHLLRNAVDHGIESPRERMSVGKPPTGTVRLMAAHEEGHIVVTVQDDGRGINRERVREVAVNRGMMTVAEAAQLDDSQVIALLFQPTMSTKEVVTGVSGRGVGLDVVRTNVKRLGGSVTVDSVQGKGTTFRITLPLTLAILQTMLVELGEDIYAIPLTGVIESLYLDDWVLNSVKRTPIIHWRNQVLPLLYLRQFFAHPRLAAPAQDTKTAIVVVSWGRLRAGLIVDKLIGKQEIVVKSLSTVVGNIPGVSGCTILGDGRVALIVDIPGLINAVMRVRQQEGSVWMNN
ncbi:MAG: chemotaxis protein CheA [Anaerolineae bacterium]|nr:chemotaxis protein CheA [Anaerolineae bacterium]